jgi:hypothetical protein
MQYMSQKCVGLNVCAIIIIIIIIITSTISEIDA